MSLKAELLQIAVTSDGLALSAFQLVRQVKARVGQRHMCEI